LGALVISQNGTVLFFMKQTSFPDTTSDDIYLETIRKRRKHTRKKRPTKYAKLHAASHSRFYAYMHQDVDISAGSIIPESYQLPVYLFLFIFLPKLIGMGFYFFFMSHAQTDLYLEIRTGGFLLDWAIGYEILMALFFFVIIKNFLFYPFAKS
jgi:hypothetical protein